MSGLTITLKGPSIFARVRAWFVRLWCRLWGRPHGYEGMTVRLTSGEEREIAHFDGTTLTVAQAWTRKPGAADTYEVRA